MQTQNWTVYQKDPDGIKIRIGQVKTSLTGTKEQAQAKAAFKYRSIGYSFHVKKGTIENDKR